MGNFEDKINKHTEKVIALLNDEKEKMLSLEELKELDMSLGMTEEEFEKMLENAKKNVALAQNHFYYKNYHDAYTTAESAVSINPHLTQALIVMADSALRIYETEDDEDFLLKAEKHAKDILKQAPAENRAVEILSKLNTYKASEKNKKKQYLKFGLIGGGVLIIILSVIFLSPKKKQLPEKDHTIKFQLIDAEENTNAAWAQVENVIARRNELIPQLFSVVKTKNAHLDALIKDVAAMKNKTESLSGNEKVSAEAGLQKKYAEITKIIAENNSSNEVNTLMIQIEGSYNRISVEGKRYNDAVKTYNILVKKYGTEYPEFKIKPYFSGQ